MHFINSELKSDYYDALDAWPDDCIEVSDAVYQEFYLVIGKGNKWLQALRTSHHGKNVHHYPLGTGGTGRNDETDAH